MKIVIVLGAFFPVPPIMGGAVEKAWYDLAQAFARRGHNVTMISRKVDSLPTEETRDDVHHLRVKGFNSPRSLLLLKFFDLLYSLRVASMLPNADIIVTNTFWLPFFRAGAYVHVGRFPKGQMRFYSRARRLQAPSHAVGRAIREEAPRLADKVSVIPYPAPSSAVPGSPPPLDARQKIVIYVGRVHPEKGVHLLVDAFVRARTVFADWKLMIVGPTEESRGGGGDRYLQELRACGDNRVEFTGGVFDQAVLEQRLRLARLFVYPSLAERGESFGLAPLEAMTQGCAVLVSQLDCFSDFVRDGETGFVFDHRADDAAGALAAKLEQIAGDGATSSRVADAGHRKSEEFSLDRVADRFLEDFEASRRHG